MLSCKDVYEHLSSKKKLTLTQKLLYPLHLLICDNCKTVHSQFNILENSFKKLINKISNVDDKKVKELEERIKKDLDK